MGVSVGVYLWFYKTPDWLEFRTMVVHMPGHAVYLPDQFAVLMIHKSLIV